MQVRAIKNGVMLIKQNKKHKIYIPKNMSKYMGRKMPVMRSTWEEKFARWLDSNPSVIRWGSENIVIHYYNPVKMRKARYYPDFYMEVEKNGKVVAYLTEIKPYKETRPPINRGRKTKKTLLWEDKTYATNNAKWVAAIKWCTKMNMIFKIVTERELFGKKK